VLGGVALLVAVVMLVIPVTAVIPFGSLPSTVVECGSVVSPSTAPSALEQLLGDDAPSSAQGLYDEDCADARRVRMFVSGALGIAGLGALLFAGPRSPSDSSSHAESVANDSSSISPNSDGWWRRLVLGKNYRSP
jgi:hypothetical protein